MNDDASTFELPEYIHSRLQPQIFIDFPERDEEYQILKENLPFAEDHILTYVTEFLQQAHAADERFTVRDGINIGRFAIKLKSLATERSHETAALSCLTVALGGLELTVAVSWAVCIDIGGEFSGSVSSVMNTWGNLGGAISAVAVGYLATHFGWTLPFLLASALCLLSAWLVSRIDPRRSAVEES